MHKIVVNETFPQGNVEVVLMSLSWCLLQVFFTTLHSGNNRHGFLQKGESYHVISEGVFTLNFVRQDSTSSQRRE